MSSCNRLDEEMIESLFGYNMQSSTKNDEGRSKTPSPTKHVLDPKRLQNITILLKALNATAEQVSGALVQGRRILITSCSGEPKLLDYEMWIFLK